MRTRILEVLNSYENLSKEIGDIIGYPKVSFIAPLIQSLSYYWKLSGGEIFLGATEEDLFEDAEQYTISSSGRRGEKYYMGEKDGLMFVLCYANDNWQETEILILDKLNQRV